MGVLPAYGVYFEIDGRAAPQAGLRGIFPHALGPFTMTPTVGITPADLKFDWGPTSALATSEHACTVPRDALRAPVSQRFAEQLPEVIGLEVSPLFPMTLIQPARAAVNSPEGAEHFVFSHPVRCSNRSLAVLATAVFAEHDPDAAFLMIGGYIYFDKFLKPLRLNAMMKSNRFDLTFEAPKEWFPAWTEALQMQGCRFHPITLPAFSDKGASAFAWIPPLFSIDQAVIPHGGFVYLFGQQQVEQEIRDLTAPHIPSTSTNSTPSALQTSAQKVFDADGAKFVSTVPPDEKSSTEIGMFDMAVLDGVSRQLPMSLVRLCILGGSTLQDAHWLPIAAAVAAEISRELAGDVVVLTGGMPGVQEAFAQCLGPEFPDVMNLVPENQLHQTGFGRDVKCGTTLQERMELSAALGDLYLTIEGGPGVAREACAAQRAGGFVLPLVATGGASSGLFGFPYVEKPAFASDEHWDCLSSPDVQPLAVARAVVGVVKSYQASDQVVSRSVQLSLMTLPVAKSSTGRGARWLGVSGSGLTVGTCAATRVGTPAQPSSNGSVGVSSFDEVSAADVIPQAAESPAKARARRATSGGEGSVKPLPQQAASSSWSVGLEDAPQASFCARIFFCLR